MQPTHRKCKGNATGATCATDMKQISIWLQETNIKNNDLFKVSTNALGLHKQDNTITTCAADVEQIIIRLANNAVNEITKIMTCSK